MFERFRLKDNAFPVTPIVADGIKWYGFSKLRKEFQEIIQRSIQETPRVCVLNRGHVGAGKTHAATYFSQEARIRNNAYYSSVVSIVVECPKQGSGAFYDLFKRIINYVGFENIETALNSCRQTMGEKSLLAELKRISANEDIAHVLAHVTDDNRLATRSYLYGSGGLRDLKALGVAAKPTSDNDFASALNAMLWALTHSGDSPSRPFRRVVLWIDEMEDLVYFPTRYYLPFTQFIRSVMDHMSEHLTLFLNFTYTEPEDLDTIENILGDAIVSRINKHILFQDSTKDDVKGYLTELLADNQIGSGRRAETAPFDSDTFEMLVSACTSHTPRYINKLSDGILRKTLEQAKKNQDLSTVTVPMVESILSKVAANL